MSTPFSRMHCANFTCAWRTLSSSAVPDDDVAGSSLQAASASAATASSATPSGRRVIGLLSVRHGPWSRTRLRAV